MNLKELIEKNEKDMDGLVTRKQIKSHLHASQVSIVEWMKDELKGAIIKTLEDRSSTTLADRIEDLLLQLNNLQ